MEHRTTLPDYPGGLKALADDLGNLRYDALQEFLGHLSNKLARDGSADFGRKRPKLADRLMNAANQIALAWSEIGVAWSVCEPHMRKAIDESTLKCGEKS